MDNHADPYVLDYEGKDIHGENAALRARGPVTQVDLGGGVLGWAVTGAAEVRQLLTDGRVGKDPEDWEDYKNKRIDEKFPLYPWINTPSAFTTKGEEHRWHRDFIAPAFLPGVIAALEPRIQEIVAGRIKDLEEFPPRQVVDIRKHFAYPIPLQVINELIGVPEHLESDLVEGVEAVFDTGASEEHRAVGYAKMTEALQSLVQYRTDNRGEDMTSTLVAEVKNPATAYQVKELIGSLYLTINAGHETTANMLCNASIALLTHPEHLKSALDGSLDWRKDIIEEALRYDSPAAHVPMRYATEDIEIGGVVIPKGAPVLVGFAGACRDPRVYGDSANEFDPTRRNKMQHIAFGHGAHRCIGAELARREGTIGLSALFKRFPNMKLAVDPSELKPVPGIVSNGPSEVPVLLHG